MVNRKLIRPNLAQVKERMAGNPQGGSRSQREQGSNGQTKRRLAPAEQTNAEAFYYLKQMNSKTPMIVVLDDGERLEGHIEWYDRNCLKVHRDTGANLLIYKHCIRYLYKQEEEQATGTAEGNPA